MIKIFSPEQTKNLCKNVPGGYELTVGGIKVYGVHCFDYYTPIPAELIQEALTEIEKVFPLHWANVEIYCTPFRPMVWKNGAFTGLEYNGQAFPGVIIMGARRELRKEEVYAITLHELAHCFGYDFIHGDPFVVGYKTTPEYAEFKRLAGIPDWVDKGTGTILWQHRPTEVLAETVRCFSGGIFVKEPFDIFQGLEPKQEAYDYVMSLMPERREIVKKEYIILHHSATPDGLVLKDFDAIKRYHMEVNGWRDIGYHWIVERIDGVLTAIPGRLESDTGAHCLGHNSDAIGICIVGDYTKTPPDDETYRFVAALCKQIKTRHPIKEVGGHRDYYATACPGNFFDVEKVRQYVKGGHTVEDIKGRWSEESINLVVKSGLMKGYPDGSFKPEQPVTREELATVLARLIKEGVPTV
jgi:hypothetical protein